VERESKGVETGSQTFLRGQANITTKGGEARFEKSSEARSQLAMINKQSESVSGREASREKVGREGEE